MNALTRHNAAAIAGLAVAWGGTGLLVSPVFQGLEDSPSIFVALAGQGALWLLLAIVIGIVLLWEGRPLRSLWLRPFEWRCLLWAAVLVAGHFVLLYPATEWLRTSMGLAGYAAGIEVALGGVAG